MTSKKLSSKKTSTKKTSVKSDASPRTEIENQLKKLIKEISIEDLKTLLHHAKIFQHNAQVLNEFNNRKKSATADDMGKKSSSFSKHTVEVIEGKDHDHFIIAINTARNFFTLEEMRKIVKLCHSATDEKDGSKRLFTWFSRERKDVIRNTYIDGPNDPALSTIYKYLISKYTVKK